MYHYMLAYNASADSVVSSAFSELLLQTSIFSQTVHILLVFSFYHGLLIPRWLSGGGF